MFVLAEAEGIPWISILVPVLIALSGVVAAFFVWLQKFISKKAGLSETEDAAMAIIFDAVNALNEEQVDTWREAAADGKLTKDEIALAKSMAYDRALAMAKGPVFDFIKVMAKERLGRIIKQFVDKLKDKKEED